MHCCFKFINFEHRAVFCRGKVLCTKGIASARSGISTVLLFAMVAKEIVEGLPKVIHFMSMPESQMTRVRKEQLKLMKV